MSENIPNKEGSEEVDLGQLFNAIGSLFDRFINFIVSIFKIFLTTIVTGLKAIINNFKLIVGVMVIFGILGYFLEKSMPPVYKSGMLVKPYFDSKYQLITNINYFNALIENEDYKTLSTIFEMQEDTIKKVTSFDIILAPETENDRILLYENFIKGVDSIRALDITFDDFVENRSVYSGSFFEISAESYKKDIFKELVVGLNASFTNEYSRNKKRKKDSLNFLQKQNLLDAINEVDSLQRIYIDVLELESKSASSQISLGEVLSFDKEKSTTKEYELLNKEIQLRDQLRQLQEQKIEDDVFFDAISSFQEVGNLSKEITQRYTLIFPILSFILLCFLFLVNRTIKFVRNYEV